MNHPSATDPGDRLSRNLRRWTSYLVRCERGVSVTMLVIILVTMGAQVFARYVLHHPFTWSEEFSRLAMIWMSFTAAAFIMAEGNHISVDVWSQRVTNRVNRNMQLISYLVVAASCLMLLLGGLRFVLKVHPVSSATMGIPKSIWYAAVSVGLLLMTLHSLVNFWLLWRTGKPFTGESVDDQDGRPETNEQSPSVSQAINHSEVRP